MTCRTSAFQRRRARLVVGIALIAVLSLAFPSLRRLLPAKRQEPTPKPPPSDAESSASRASTLTNPDDAEAVSLRFEAAGKDPALVEPSVIATVTASSGEERGLYTIVGMSCGRTDGPTNTQSVNRCTEQKILFARPLGK